MTEDKLKIACNKLVQSLKHLEGFMGVAIDRQKGCLELRINPDYLLASQMPGSIDDIPISILCVGPVVARPAVAKTLP